jgi:hypothetical protein
MEPVGIIEEERQGNDKNSSEKKSRFDFEPSCS